MTCSSGAKRGRRLPKELSSSIVLDHEAVQALLDHDSTKHRIVRAHLRASATRRKRKEIVNIVAPASARVEAGWVSSKPSVALADMIPTKDHPLDRVAANKAAGVRLRTGVSVVDAHVAVAADDLATIGLSVTVLTSDFRHVHRAVELNGVHVIAV